MKLNPEELVVASFETDAAAQAAGTVAIIRPTTFTDPTAETWCYICPQETYGCW